MDSEVGDQGVAAKGTGMPKHATYSEMDFLRLRNSFFKVLEELRMRRYKDLENETKIDDLMKSKHKYLQHIEEQSQKCAILEKSMQENEKSIEDKFYEKQKHLEQEKAKLEAMCAVKEKKFKSLTDEIRSLQMNKHTLENKVREKESVISLHNDSRNVCMKQFEQLEHECASITAQVDQVFEQLELLKGNVTESIDLNKKLSFVNSHQNCSMDELKQQLQSLTEDLLQAKSTTQSTTFTDDSCSLMNDDTQEQTQTNELDGVLQQKLDSLQQEHQATLVSLKEAHQLISKHVNACNKAVESKNVLGEKVNELSKSYEISEAKLLQKQTQLQQLQEHHEVELDQLKSQVQDLVQRLATLQTDFTTLQASHDSLEEKLSEAVENKIDLNRKLNNCMKEKEEMQQQIMSLLVSSSKEAESIEKNQIQMDISIHEQSQEENQSTISKGSSNSCSQTNLPLYRREPSPKHTNNPSLDVDVVELSKEITEMVVEAIILKKEEADDVVNREPSASSMEEMPLQSDNCDDQTVNKPALPPTTHCVSLDMSLPIVDGHLSNINNIEMNGIRGNNSPVNNTGTLSINSIHGNSIPVNNTHVDGILVNSTHADTGHSVDNVSPIEGRQQQTVPLEVMSPRVPVQQEQMLFSDDEDQENDMDLERSINRVQSYLNRDRLKRPRSVRN